MKTVIYLSFLLQCFPMAAEAQFVAKPLNFPDTKHNVYTYSILDAKHSWFGADHIDWTTLTLYDFPYAIKTSDGGDSWEFDSIPMPGSIIAVQELSAVDTNICYYVLTDSDVTFHVWKTTDGGISWSQKTTSQFSGVFIDFIHAFSADTVTAFGDVNGGYWEIERSLDGGDSWTRVPSAFIPAPLSGEYSNWRYHSVRGDTVWFATSRGRCYKSVNKGQNWSVTPVITVSGVECDVKFASALNGVFFKSAKSGGAKITSDGGMSWTTATTISNQAIISASPVEGWPQGFMYSAATLTPGIVDIYFTPDLFSTNTLISAGIASSGILSFSGPTTGWLSGSGTKLNNIYKFEDVLTEINNARKDNTLSLFPNPSFSSSLLKIPGNSGPANGNISVYDMLGRKIFGKTVDAGQEWTNLDAGNFINGIYIVVFTDGSGRQQNMRWVVKH